MTYTPKGVIVASDISVAQLSDIVNNLGTVTQGDFGGSLANATGTYGGALDAVTGTVDGVSGSYAGSLTSTTGHHTGEMRAGSGGLTLARVSTTDVGGVAGATVRAGNGLIWPDVSVQLSSDNTGNASIQLSCTSGTVSTSAGTVDLNGTKVFLKGVDVTTLSVDSNGFLKVTV